MNNLWKLFIAHGSAFNSQIKNPYKYSWLKILFTVHEIIRGSQNNSLLKKLLMAQKIIHGSQNNSFATKLSTAHKIMQSSNKIQNSQNTPAIRRQKTCVQNCVQNYLQSCLHILATQYIKN